MPVEFQMYFLISASIRRMGCNSTPDDHVDGMRKQFIGKRLHSENAISFETATGSFAVQARQRFPKRVRGNNIAENDFAQYETGNEGVFRCLDVDVF